MKQGYQGSQIPLISLLCIANLLHEDSMSSFYHFVHLFNIRALKKLVEFEWVSVSSVFLG